MPDMKDLYAQVDAALDDILALEQALVRIPSVNTGFMPTGNETAVAAAEVQRDREPGLHLDAQRALPGRALERRAGREVEHMSAAVEAVHHRIGRDVGPLESPAPGQPECFGAARHEGDEAQDTNRHVLCNRSSGLMQYKFCYQFFVLLDVLEIAFHSEHEV